MRRVIICIIVSLLIFPTTLLGGNKDRRKSYENWENYEIVTIKVGTEGTKFVKVWGYGRTVDKAVMQAKKNAIHACLFRGLPGSTSAMATPAICSGANAFAENEDYFINFFSAGGPYLAYCNMTTDGIPAGQDNLKVKGGYKVGIYVQILYDNLKAKMQADGLVKKLSSGF